METRHLNTTTADAIRHLANCTRKTTEFLDEADETLESLRSAIHNGRQREALALVDRIEGKLRELGKLVST